MKDDNVYQSPSAREDTLVSDLAKQWKNKNQTVSIVNFLKIRSSHSNDFSYLVYILPKYHQRKGSAWRMTLQSYRIVTHTCHTCVLPYG